MKILIATMGKSLEIGVNLIEMLRDKIQMEKVGFFVADSLFYKQFSKNNSFIDDPFISILKEWEFTRIFKEKKPNWERIAKYEKYIGDPVLWNALMADRRIFFGKHCKYKQQYKSRFTYEQLMIILDQALVKIDRFINRISPDLILSFGTATMGDYLIYLFAKKKNIPYFQIKATKIENYLAFHDTAVGVSSTIVDTYNSAEPFSKDINRDIEVYIKKITNQGLQYEGAILSSRSRLVSRLNSAPLEIMRSLAGFIKIQIDPETRHDIHIPGAVVPSIYTNLLQPIKAFRVEKSICSHSKYFKKGDLDKMSPFVFFPLHFEPEVSLQVFGRPYQNQIELIRNIALSLPVGQKIVVKEHPRSLGFRPLKYYKKLLEIPNVYLIDPFVKGYEIIKYACLVAVITGSLGFEAAINKIPVITFGNAPYNLLPDKMVWHVTDLNCLGEQIDQVLNQYQFEPYAIRRYIGAFIQESVPVDLYSVLLRKQNRYSNNPNNFSESELLSQGYQSLVKYCLDIFNKKESKGNCGS